MGKQKMWVRRVAPFDWEAGCQCCGQLIYLGPSWRRAFKTGLEHAREHGHG